MRFTNKHDLPQPLVKLLERQTYSRGRANISVTELITAPQIVALRRKHRHEMVEDVADRLWAIMGTNIHKILEEAADAEHIPEERLFVSVGGWVVSGQVDLQRSTSAGHSRHPGIDPEPSYSISDWKFTSVWSVRYPKREWEQQLNLYAYLVERVKGVQVERAEVIALLRDWRRKDAYRIDGYPQAPVVRVDIPLWPYAEREAFLQGRVALHQDALRDFDWTGELPECTDEDRWARGKPSAKANPGAGTRCTENYCGVADWCPQLARLAMGRKAGQAA